MDDHGHIIYSYNRCADEKNRRVKRRASCHWIGPGFFFDNVPLTAEQRTIKPANASKDIVYRVMFEVVKI
jgi:hypothetical protein